MGNISANVSVKKKRGDRVISPLGLGFKSQPTNQRRTTGKTTGRGETTGTMSQRGINGPNDGRRLMDGYYLYT